MMRYFFLLVLAGLLSACFGSGGVAPQNRYYHLADISSEVNHLDRPFGVIAVNPLRSDALHHDRMILYSLKSTPLMLNTYYYHLWTNSPGKLIQEDLIDYLREVRFAKSIVRYGERQHIDGQITGYIQRFERIVGGGKSGVAVRIELSFIPQTPGDKHAMTRIYNVQRTASDNSMESTVAAFSAALQTIYGRFVADVLRNENGDRPNP
ncbi:MAG: ABC-type transport auxiliary lipoprotein family protein [Gammaproteobacteria bacterium]|jgi:ABC-type uncharacterized transport system auxiliary subunit